MVRILIAPPCELDEGHTDALLRESFAAQTTANAVCWLTPDVAGSDAGAQYS